MAVMLLAHLPRHACDCDDAFIAKAAAMLILFLHALSIFRFLFQFLR